MVDLLQLDGPRFGPAPGRARRLVLFLHGLGADGDDLISLAPYFAEALPDTAFVSPHAPFPCDMAPFGRQWFSLQDRSPTTMLAGVRVAAPVLNAFIDAERDRFGLADRNVALIGFSQGTMMSLYVAPRRSTALAAVLGYSGALVGADDLVNEVKSKPAILLVHGDVDPIVPFPAMNAAAKGLKAAGISALTLGRPGLGHSIDEEGIAAGIDFLAASLPPK